jgi:hypothetical protein
VTAGVGEGDADAEDRGKCVGRGGQRWEGVEVETGERDCVCRGDRWAGSHRVRTIPQRRQSTEYGMETWRERATTRGDKGELKLELLQGLVDPLRVRVIEF